MLRGDNRGEGKMREWERSEERESDLYKERERKKTGGRNIEETKGTKNQ